MGAMYLTLKSLFDQFGKETAMIQVGMSDKNSIDGFGGYGERLKIPFLKSPFLIQTTIDQYSTITVF
jgi:hypothetical protein